MKQKVCHQMMSDAIRCHLMTAVDIPWLIDIPLTPLTSYINP